MARRPKGASNDPQSVQDTLTPSRIALSLLSEIAKKKHERKNKRTTKPLAAGGASADKFNVIIEFNRGFPGGVAGARLTLLRAYRDARNKNGMKLDDASAERLNSLVASFPQSGIDTTTLVKAFEKEDTLDVIKSLWTDSYVFGTLSEDTIGRLSLWTLPIAENAGVEKRAPSTGKPEPVERKSIPLIYKIWADLKITRCVYESRRTVKCDAAFASFAADGKGVVWAVADTGIDGKHPHFNTVETLNLPDGLMHRDFTRSDQNDDDSRISALTDRDGHGTHVAGIIAGMTSPEDQGADSVGHVRTIKIQKQKRNDKGLTDIETVTYNGSICGISPYCRLLSLKVLQNHDDGDLSNILAAIGYIQSQNDNGRHIKIHGLNLSLGYTMNAKWFAAGQSPLCVEVDRLVRSGVCVVVAAGNGGYGTVSVLEGGTEQVAHLGAISDPGNAALAITVGSTHRDMPHAYGISYFSGKGPTSDGRMKPDLVAPGERIISCALFDAASERDNVAPFREDSGTSMAAPHVSGAVAAFLSVRGEFKGRPEIVKDILVAAATDLKRRPEFQGGGLLDLMRALQSV